MYLAMSRLRSEADIWAGLQRVCFGPSSGHKERPIRGFPYENQSFPDSRRKWAMEKFSMRCAPVLGAHARLLILGSR